MTPLEMQELNTEELQYTHIGWEITRDYTGNMVSSITALELPDPGPTGAPQVNEPAVGYADAIRQRQSAL